MNPEFRRNVWIECTPMRMLGFGAFLGLLFLAAVASSGKYWPEALGQTASIAAGLVALFWGARKAADIVASELRERTWDQQRLSGLGPAAMYLGKFFGATSFVWLIMLTCIGAMTVSMLAADPLDPSNTNPTDQLMRMILSDENISAEVIIISLCGWLLLFASSSFAAMLAISEQERYRRFDISLFQIFGIVSMIGLSGLLASAATFGAIRHLDRSPRALTLDTNYYELKTLWWNIELSISLVLCLGTLFFALWAMYGGYHQMRKSFVMRTTAAPWIIFLPTCAILWAGFDTERASIYALIVMGACCITAALFEPHRVMRYREWLSDLSLGKAVALIQGPAWIYAWVGAAICLVLVLTQTEIPAPQWASEEFEGKVHWSAAALLAFMLRDAGVCVWAGLRSKDGRGLWTAMLIFAALYIILPILIGVGARGEAEMLSFVFPIGIEGLISGAVQAAVIWILAARELTAPAAPASAQ